MMPFRVSTRISPLVGQPLVMHETHEAAGAIAALLDLATIGIEDAVAEIDTGLARLLDQQDLVTADTEMAVGQVNQLFRAEGNLLAHAVEDNEIVAQTVHFGEFEFHVPLR
jgi:hypothetical protein